MAVNAERSKTNHVRLLHHFHSTTLGPLNKGEMSMIINGVVHENLLTRGCKPRRYRRAIYKTSKVPSAKLTVLKKAYKQVHKPSAKPILKSIPKPLSRSYLVSDKTNLHATIAASVIPYALHPVGDIVQSLGVGHIVHKDDAVRPPVKRLGYLMKPLLRAKGTTINT